MEFSQDATLGLAGPLLHRAIAQPFLAARAALPTALSPSPSSAPTAGSTEEEGEDAAEAGGASQAGSAVARAVASRSVEEELAEATAATEDLYRRLLSSPVDELLAVQGSGLEEGKEGGWQLDEARQEDKRASLPTGDAAKGESAAPLPAAAAAPSVAVSEAPATATSASSTASAAAHLQQRQHAAAPCTRAAGLSEDAYAAPTAAGAAAAWGLGSTSPAAERLQLAARQERGIGEAGVQAGGIDEAVQAGEPLQADAACCCCQREQPGRAAVAASSCSQCAAADGGAGQRPLAVATFGPEQCPAIAAQEQVGELLRMLSRAVARHAQQGAQRRAELLSRLHPAGWGETALAAQLKENSEARQRLGELAQRIQALRQEQARA